MWYLWLQKNVGQKIPPPLFFFCCCWIWDSALIKIRIRDPGYGINTDLQHCADQEQMFSPSSCD
jgi:hypothetical protein